MDIHNEAKEIIGKYIKEERKIYYISNHFLKRIIRTHIYEDEQQIGVFGYQDDVKRFVRCAPDNMHITIKEIAEPDNWLNKPGCYFYGEEQIKKLAACRIDKLIIVSDEIRYLAQMYFIDERVPFEVVDIFDVIKREYGRVMVGAFSHGGIVIAKELIKSIGIWLSEKTGAFSKTQIVQYWKESRKQQSDCENYDAILVKRYKAEQAGSDKTRKYYLREIIINYMLIRDYESAFRYVKEYNQLIGSEDNEFMKAKKAFDELFVRMKQKLSQRKGKDIFLFWCDSVPYKKFEEFGFLKEEAEDSMFFENAYAHNPYTHTTAQALFTGLPFFEGELYDWTRPNFVEKGKTLDILEKNGYELCEIDMNCIREKYMRNLVYTVKSARAPAAMCLWEAMARLLENEDKKQFIVCHMTCEMHPPYWNGISSKMRLGSNSVHADETLLEAQIRESARYMEQQIMWYTNLLGENTCKIYMSDHGQGFPIYMEKRIHTFFFVKDKGIKAGRYKRFFSYLDFYKLLEYILSPSEEGLERFFSDYALIQGDHPYAKVRCEDILRKYKQIKVIEPEKWIAFRGIIKDRYRLIRFPDNKELWLDECDNRVNPEDITEQELVEFMRAHVGSQFPNIDASEHYKETRKLYDALKKDLCGD